MVECSFKNQLVAGSSPVAVTQTLISRLFRGRSSLIFRKLWSVDSQNYAVSASSGHSHTKRNSGVILFVYVMFLSCLVPSLSARGQNLVGSFSNINLNTKFWKKYNWRKPKLYFKISQSVPKWNSNEWSKLFYFSLFKFQEEILVFIFWKYLKEMMNGILNGGKTLSEPILEKYLGL